MADSRHGQEDDTVDPKVLDQQEGRKNSDSTDIEHQGASDESGAPASCHPSDPPDCERQAPHIAPHYSFDLDLDEAVDRLDQGHLTATLIAPVDSQPYNYIGWRPTGPPRNIRDGYTSLEDVIGPLLGSSTSHQHDETLTQAQVDESFRLRCLALDPVDHHHFGTNSTPDGGLDHEMTAPLQLGQHDSTNRDSREPEYVGYTTALQYGLLEGSRNSEPPGLLRETTALQPSPQLVVTPAPPSPQRYPFGQPAFGQDTHGLSYPLPEPEGPSVDHNAHLHQDYGAGAGLPHNATGQGYGGHNDDEYPVASQDYGGMPPPVQHQRRRGPPLSYEAWSNQNSGPSQPTFGYASTAANQSTSPGSFAHSSDAGAASDRIPLSQHLAYNMGQSSGLSAPSTQQLTPGSSESNVFDWSSISATTPSPGEAISTSNADPARPFVCEEQDCKRKGKGFMTRASLRKHKETHNPEKKNRHKCQFCGRGFRYPNDRDNHENSLAHGGSGVQCPDCGRRLSRQDNLARHGPSCPGAAGNQ